MSIAPEMTRTNRRKEYTRDPYPSNAHEVDQIIRAAGSEFGVTYDEMTDRHIKSRSIADARAVAVYILRDRLQKSHPECARALGLKNHTTCVHQFHRVRGSANLMIRVHNTEAAIDAAAETIVENWA